MRKIKWGILGTAMICERDTIPGMLLSNNAELYAIAGRNKDKADGFKSKYGFKKAYYDYESLLDDPEIEAVYIPLPNTMHCEWSIKALNKHKHVLCEKPIAPSREDAEKMFDAARKNGVLLMEAFAYQHSPFMTALSNDIKSIGKINYISSKFLTSSYEDTNIRMRRETRGGSLYDLGVYSLSFILSILGEVPESCKAVAEFSNDNIDLLTHAILKYRSGVTADITSGMVMEKEENRWQCDFVIDGTKGTIVSNEFIFNGRGKQSYTIIDRAGDKVERVVDAPHNYMLEVEQLGNCIIAGDAPKVAEQFSLDNATTVDMILREIGY